MASIERTMDRAALRAKRMRENVDAELRFSRLDRDLSIAAVSAATGMSQSEISRIERGVSAGVPLDHLCALGATVGLDVALRTFPAGLPLRDAPQLGLLRRFRSLLDADILWRSEVPVPLPGDQRAWDAVISRIDWRYGVEGETGPRDAQALARRIELKARDTDVDGVLLVLPATRRIRAFLREALSILEPNFPVLGRDAVRRLRSGENPGGSSIIVI